MRKKRRLGNLGTEHDSVDLLPESKLSDKTQRIRPQSVVIAENPKVFVIISEREPQGDVRVTSERVRIRGVYSQFQGPNIARNC